MECKVKGKQVNSRRSWKTKKKNSKHFSLKLIYILVFLCFYIYIHENYADLIFYINMWSVESKSGQFFECFRAHEFKRRWSWWCHPIFRFFIHLTLLNTSKCHIGNFRRTPFQSRVSVGSIRCTAAHMNCMYVLLLYAYRIYAWDLS